MDGADENGDEVCRYCGHHLPSLKPAGAIVAAISGHGLTAWQIAVVTTYIDKHIGRPIRISSLAATLKLSRAHFSRLFRETFGAPPHRYVSRKRIERAQSLMMKTEAPLVQIAITVGLADQPHFNRLFRRFVGETPRAWRRDRVARALMGQF